MRPKSKVDKLFHYFNSKLSEVRKLIEEAPICNTHKAELIELVNTYTDNNKDNQRLFALCSYFRLWKHTKAKLEHQYAAAVAAAKNRVKLYDSEQQHMGSFFYKENENISDVVEHITKKYLYKMEEDFLKSDIEARRRLEKAYKTAYGLEHEDEKKCVCKCSCSS